MTATRCIAILALTKAVFGLYGCDEEQIVLDFYVKDLARKCGTDFVFPSFSILAKYWQDPSRMSTIVSILC